jgi:hypothetical protein
MFQTFLIFLITGWYFDPIFLFNFTKIISLSWLDWLKTVSISFLDRPNTETILLLERLDVCIEFYNWSKIYYISRMYMLESVPSNWLD